MSAAIKAQRATIEFSIEVDMNDDEDDQEITRVAEVMEKRLGALAQELLCESGVLRIRVKHFTGADTLTYQR